MLACPKVQVNKTFPRCYQLYPIRMPCASIGCLSWEHIGRDSTLKGGRGSRTKGSRGCAGFVPNREGWREFGGVVASVWALPEGREELEWVFAGGGEGFACCRRTRFCRGTAPRKAGSGYSALKIALPALGPETFRPRRTYRPSGDARGALSVVEHPNLGDRLTQ